MGIREVFARAFPPNEKMRFIEGSGATLRHPSGALVHGPTATQVILDALGDDINNSAVYAVISTYVNHYTEPFVRVFSGPFGDVERAERLDNHSLYRIFRRPNSSRFITWKKMLRWTKWMTKTDGNAYWFKVRAGGGDVTTNVSGTVEELWPVSPFRVEPVTEKGSGDFISYYAYDVGHGNKVRIPVENVIHFIDEIDNNDHRKGCGPVRRILREKIADTEATLFIGAILANAGVPGLVISPDGEVELTEEVAEDIKEKILLKTTGDKRGEPLVLSASTKIAQYGFSPDSLALRDVWSHLEERISGVINVPPVLAGLGAGLDAATYSNIKTAREMFVETTMVAAWGEDAESLTLQLGPDFALSDNEFIAFDWTNVRALQDDARTWRDWAVKAWMMDSITLGQFYKIVDMENPDPETDDLRKSDITVTQGLGAPFTRSLPDGQSLKAQVLSSWQSEFEGLLGDSEAQASDALEEYLTARKDAVVKRFLA